MPAWKLSNHSHIQQLGSFEVYHLPARLYIHTSNSSSTLPINGWASVKWAYLYIWVCISSGTNSRPHHHCGTPKVDWNNVTSLQWASIWATGWGHMICFCAKTYWDQYQCTSCECHLQLTYCSFLLLRYLLWYRHNWTLPGQGLHMHMVTPLYE